jgi:hypothetical protein
MSIVLLDLANLLYNYELNRAEGRELSSLKDQILKLIEESEMAPLYAALSEKFAWNIDNELLSNLKYLYG